jgi:hypothetical protein
MLLAAVAACGLVATVVFAQTGAGRTATVTLNTPVYIGAEVSDVPLRVLAPGTILKVKEQQGQWVLVEFEDAQFGRRVGWVQTKLIEIPRPDLQPVDSSIAEDSAAQQGRANALRRAEPTVATQQPFTQVVGTTHPVLTDEKIQMAIQAGVNHRGQMMALVLKDSGQTFSNVMNALGSNNSRKYTSTGFSCEVYTPMAWIAHQASIAAKRYQTFDASMVTLDMTAPVLRVVANPDVQNYDTSEGMVGTSSVDHVVLRSTDGRKVAQPLTEETFTVGVFQGANATFSVDAMNALRDLDPKKEFLITIIGATGKEKSFMVKEKHFPWIAQ